MDYKKLLKKYLRNESDNCHGENAQLLVDNFGTQSEKDEITQINNRHEKLGHIVHEDYMRRYEISGKYYKTLVDLAE